MTFLLPHLMEILSNEQSEKVVVNGKVCSGPKAISVAGANGKDEINYKMWVIQTPGLNDPDSFTFKTV